MTPFDRVKKLADKRKISIVELEEKVGFSKNSLYSWKKNNPSTEKLEAVADFFNVTTDYLLGRDTQDVTNPDDDLTAFFRINTEGMSEDEIDTLKEELEDFMIIRAERLKRRKKAKKDD
ncbi:helix-turn-helix domain-containing protein [Carnobacterium maltaromaticum]|uniref:helix-turn-helix domain-containing protein n=1 Tax=Carnobacterium maltaromaticum TaxID=2751 RepID=UPI003B980EF6